MNLNKFPQILYAVSTVDDGNMSVVRGDPKEARENRRIYLNIHDVRLEQAIVPHLTQSSHALRVTKADIGKGMVNDQNPTADALLTNEPGVYLFLVVADCHAIALFDPLHNAIALVHAGREGLGHGILEASVAKMAEEFSTNPSNLIAQFSPSIGPCCYLRPPGIKESFDSKWRRYLDKRGNLISINIWEFAEDTLLKLGIPKDNITNPKMCNYHSIHYYSHREADDKKFEHDYRFGVILGLKQ